ncbi:MAG: phosphate acyltransferase PlsX [Gammaproteobacteria bacterium]|nr:phosphate acyltransferase PlsX [Gammaproteobacteria bacterium]NBT43563.1 phosphate acyltransferase PlsX [Gammaproteobacteria bacterium]NBY23361.1 phosphate acyltransferase PlsX [Gammaproteobacteria bacterium]
MSRKLTIALDAMGGDHGPEVTVPAAIDSVSRYPNLHLILVGDEAKLRAELDRGRSAFGDRIQVRHASEMVEMHETPSKALRGKKDSSMRVAINMVKDGTADACVSAGNTGALMAIAKFVLKTIPGVDRPAIIAMLPSKTGHTHVLDLGANVDCTAEHLCQFAVMGYELVKAVENNQHPRVGLLNIGEEEIKGNEQVKQAAKLLTGTHINFVGFVEGNDIFSGNVEVVVTDGFTGNVALKAIEGFAKLLGGSLRDEFGRNLVTKVLGLLALPVLRAFKGRFDPRRYNGASLVGLRGIVVKSHGNADRTSVANAIRVAMLEVEMGVPDRIGQRVAEVFAEERIA